MKELKFGESRLRKFIRGKGFYAALAVCLVAAGASAWVGISRTNDQIDQNNSKISSEVTNSWSFLEEADRPQSNVPITSQSPSVSSSPSGSESSSSVSSAPSDSPSSSAGQQTQLFILPVSGELQKDFSGNELVFCQTMGDYRTHNGLDIKATVDTPVKSVSAGTVARVYEDGMWGHVVEIRHGEEYLSRYCGLSKNIRVKEGQPVGMGEVIGTVGNTAVSETVDPSHLHYELLRSGKYIDPTEVLIDFD